LPGEGSTPKTVSSGREKTLQAPGEKVRRARWRADRVAGRPIELTIDRPICRPVRAA
jgi:hypothetical protein